MKSHLPFIFLSFFLFSTGLYAQVYSDKVLSEKRKETLESYEETAKNNLLPIWGQKARELGFDLPYSAGLGINYVTQESKILINNLKVGFNNGPLYELDEIVFFNDATASGNVINVRPDIWLFPFLNVYGIFARVDASTSIDATLRLPNQDGFEDIFSFGTTVDFEGTTAGFGLTPTIGVGGGWFALDMNFSWTDLPELEDPAYSFVLGPRIGKTFYFSKPEQNLAVWVGGFRVALNTGTSGSLNFDEIFGFDGNLEQKINDGLIKVEEKQVEVEAWYASLSPAQQAVNLPKYTALNRVLSGANTFLNRLDEARENSLNSTVQYSIDKKQKNPWNFVVGAQYQLNKHFMLRGEYGFLGERTQFIGGLQYRFQL